MSIKEKRDQYKIIAMSGNNVEDRINAKIMEEESKYSKSKTKKFIEQVEKETNTDLSSALLWNDLKD